MGFLEEHLLSAIVFLPLLGALICLAFPKGEDTGVRGFALTVALLDLVLACWMWARFNAGQPGMQLSEHGAWIPSLGISYAMAVDGVALILILLTAFLAPIVVLSTYSSVEERVREFMVCLLFLQTGMLGSFAATDLFLFYTFYEIMLVPMYFLIGIWGGRRRIYAALKFFLYTMTGSLLMLVAIIYTVWSVKDQGGLTFDWAAVTQRIVSANMGSTEIMLFLAFAFAFAIKDLLKPFSFERFIKACGRANELFQLKNKPADTDEYPDFFVNVEYTLVKIIIADINYIEGLKDYIKIHLSTNERPILTRMSIKAIEEKLPPSQFIRTHKSFLVAAKKVTTVKRDFVCIGSQEIPVSASYKENIAHLIQRG